MTCCFEGTRVGRGLLRMNCLPCAQPSRFSFELSATIKGTNSYKIGIQVFLSKIYSLFIQSLFMYSKTVIRKLEEQRTSEYLMPKEVRIKLGYPEGCVKDCSGDAGQEEMVGISAKIQKSNDKTIHLRQLVICNMGLEIIFKMAGSITWDHNRATNNSKFDSLKKEVEQAIKGKTLVGYQMGQLLSLLQAEHSKFIDVAYLYPWGFPKKQTLRRIAQQVLGISLSNQYKYQNYENRRQPMLEDDDSDDRDQRRRPIRRDRNSAACQFLVTIESANVCLKVAEKHIKEGRGIITTVSTEKGEFRDVYQVLAEAEIDKNMVCGLFLRGSRALGIEVMTQKYNSDWDYVCVLDTTATINSILLKLHNIDLLLLDRKSFYIYVNGGDLPMIELFFLPAHCIYINRLQPPIISVINSKHSLVYNLQKSDQKLSYYSLAFYKTSCPQRPYQQKPGAKNNYEFDERGRPIRQRRDYREPQKHQLQMMQCSTYEPNADPQYVKWKFIKIMHTQVRYLDLYLQIKENSRILDTLSKTELWKRLKSISESRGHFAAYRICKEEVNKLLCEAFTYSQLYFHNFHLSNKQTFTDQQRRRGGGRNRRYNRERDDREYRNRNRNRYRYGNQRWDERINYSRKEQIDYQLLSIYRNSKSISSDQMDEISRVNDIDDDESEFSLNFWQRQMSNYNPREPSQILLNTNTLNNKECTNSFFLSLLNQNLDVSEKNFKYLFATIFLQPSSFYSIKYIQKTNFQLPEDHVSSLTNFIPQENADLELPIVQQASACILRSHLTEFQHKTSVKTLVCFMYKPFIEYNSIKDDDKKVSLLEGKQFDIFEKRDGVLTALYYSGNGWVVGSRRTPDGREPISDEDSSTISEEFVRIFGLLGYKMPELHDKFKVFLFELLSTRIKNIIPKIQDELILHGVRDMKTLSQENPEQYEKYYSWKGAEKITLDTKSFEKIAQIVENRRECQGFILRDDKFNRIVVRNSLILKQNWKRQLDSVLSHPRHRFNKNELIDANRKVYFIYSQIFLKKMHKKYLELFPENQEIIDGILQYVQQVNRKCQKKKEQLSHLTWKDPKINQFIVDQRIDILTYLRGYCYREHPEMFEGRIHTSVNFNKAFSFLIQHLHNRHIAMS